MRIVSIHFMLIPFRATLYAEMSSRFQHKCRRRFRSNPLQGLLSDGSDPSDSMVSKVKSRLSQMSTAQALSLRRNSCSSMWYLKSFVAVDEDYGNLVVIEAPDFGVGVDVDFTPGEAAPLVELDDALFDDFAEMTSLAGITMTSLGFVIRRSVAV